MLLSGKFATTEKQKLRTQLLFQEKSDSATQSRELSLFSEAVQASQERFVLKVRVSLASCSACAI